MDKGRREYGLSVVMLMEDGARCYLALVYAVKGDFTSCLLLAKVRGSVFSSSLFLCEKGSLKVFVGVFVCSRYKLILVKDEESSSASDK